MPYCTNCGLEISFGASFCPNCGTPVSAPLVAKPVEIPRPPEITIKEEPKAAAIKLTSLGVIGWILIIIGVACMVYTETLYGFGQTYETRPYFGVGLVIFCMGLLAEAMDVFESRRKPEERRGRD